MSNWEALKEDYKKRSLTINMNILQKSLGMCSFKCSEIEKALAPVVREQSLLFGHTDTTILGIVHNIRDTVLYKNKHWQRSSIRLQIKRR